jgi:hypothetical protein
VQLGKPRAKYADINVGNRGAPHAGCVAEQAVEIDRIRTNSVCGQASLEAQMLEVAPPCIEHLGSDVCLIADCYTP